ncbi:hypothetical protein [Lachnotalea glycerini]|uniref:Uncharacterized protein n=1 Tax=Lachnotalea glycerini TaxID=1763509 RepID=A0A371JGY9_9FIRM|nr:hypothetical protein [Lachnotalea glycerini]RDY32000.1 hypothetical protein CG710_006780 [Lachnotalea glycerini]
MNKKELIEYVEQLNIDIEFSNITKPPHERVKPYDITKILEGYHSIMWKEDIKAFRKKYDCQYCFYYEKPRQCKAMIRCPLEDGKTFTDKVAEPKKCIKDEKGTCPYGKCVEICIGYCMKEIVEDHNKRWHS